MRELILPKLAFSSELANQIRATIGKGIDHAIVSLHPGDFAGGPYNRGSRIQPNRTASCDWHYRNFSCAGLRFGCVAATVGRTWAPHGKNGPVLNGADPSNQGVARLDGQSSARVGAAGGNVGLLDGSVSWRKIGQMQVYQGSLGWRDSGCIAMW